MTTLTDAPAAPLRLGLRENLAQFSLLVAVNALVGGMIGQERIVLPLLAEREFGITAFTAGLTFIAAFGAVKAVTNFFAGTLSDRYGRKPVLVAGWIIGVPVPLLLIWAPSWGWVIAANVLLGINQGLTWSTTVIMKIDLVGPERRGFAMGFNEAAGYGALALTALATGYIADNSGLRPEPFYLGIAFAALGLGLSTLFVRETRGYADLEARAPRPAGRRVSTRRGVPSDQLHGQGDVLVQPGRDGEQPQRRPRLGAAADLLRRRRPQRRPDRRARRALPGGLGPRAADHRRPLGSLRPQAASSLAACSPRRSAIGWIAATTGFAPWALGADRARCGDGDGVPDADRGDRRRRPPVLASPIGRRLPALARRRIRRRRAPRRRHRRLVLRDRGDLGRRCSHRSCPGSWCWCACTRRTQ